MMQTSSLELALVSTTAAHDYQSCWCRLEQIMPDEIKRSATVADLIKLWLVAATGGSASRVRPDDCPVEIDGETSTIIAYLGFYIWPSHPDLEYLLHSTFGRFSNPRSVSAARSFSVMINNTRRYALPYYMTGVQTTWESPVYTAGGEQILPRPTITVEDGIWLVFSEECFGALRVNGSARGASVVLELKFIKPASTRPLNDAERLEWWAGPNGEIILSPPPDTITDTYRITDFKNVISVSFSCEGLSGGDDIDTGDIDQTNIITETLDVVLPKCLEDLLNFCPDTDIAHIFCEQIPTTTIYFNACTGEILGETTKRDSNSYCSKIVDSPLSGLGWLPEDEQ